MIDYRYTSLDNSVGWKVDATGDFVRDENGMKILDVWKYKDQYGVRFYDPQPGGWNYLTKNAENFIHTFSTFGLFPVKKPVISPPKPKINIVDLEGSSTSIDFTESLTGRVEYARRSGSFRFVTFAPREYWDSILRNVINALNGKRKWVVLDESTAWFYDGRLTVGNPEYKKDKMFINISGDFEPYKKNMTGTLDDWLWDPFDLEHGVIYGADAEVKGLQVLAGQTDNIDWNCGDLPSTFAIRFNSYGRSVKTSFTLENSNGTKTHEVKFEINTAPPIPEYVFYDFITTPGSNRLTITNNENSSPIVVAINYRELSL